MRKAMQHGSGVVVTGMACLCAAGDSPAAASAAASYLVTERSTICAPCRRKAAATRAAELLAELLASGAWDRPEFHARNAVT